MRRQIQTGRERSIQVANRLERSLLDEEQQKIYVYAAGSELETRFSTYYKLKLKEKVDDASTMTR